MNGPRRVLYIHHNPDAYGASRCLVRLFERLDRNEFSPIVLLPEDGPMRPMLEKLKVPIIYFSHLSVITRPVFKSWRIIPFIFNFPISALRLSRLIKKNKIDIVHTNTGVIVSGGMAAKMAGVPHIWHIRDWFQEFRSFWKLYSRYILWTSDKILCVSKAMADQFPPSEKVRVVNDGFSPGEFELPKAELRKQFREQYQLGNELVIGCVGRIKFVRKGQEILVQAAGLLARKGKKAKYLIVGAPFQGNENHLDELKKMARDLGVESQIIFTGELSDARPAYAAMDIFVLPSAQPEPFGGVTIEAMAMGLPVIATNIGGSVDQVGEGETGFLVPPGNPAALAEKIETLMENAELRKRMGEAGPMRVQHRFSLEKMTAKIEDAYRDAKNTSCGCEK